MRIIHTADWHFGANHDHWPDQLASRRRQEREAAVRQVLDYAISKTADYLVVAGDVCDVPEKMPASIIEGLEAVKRSGCVPVLFFTNAGHDARREWWAGTAMGPYTGHPTHKTIEGRGYRLPHTAVFDNAAFAAFDHIPSLEEVAHLQASAVPRVLLLHAREGATAGRLEALREVFSYIACGDCHEPRAVLHGFAHYSGSPSFRDLSSIDAGPRSFADVQINGSEVVVDAVKIVTSLSAVLAFDAGRVTANDGFGAVPVPLTLSEALDLLPEEYAYVKVEVSAEQVQQVRDDLPAKWTAGPTAGKSLLLARK